MDGVTIRWEMREWLSTLGRRSYQSGNAGRWICNDLPTDVVAAARSKWQPWPAAGACHVEFKFIKFNVLKCFSFPTQRPSFLGIDSTPPRWASRLPSATRLRSSALSRWSSGRWLALPLTLDSSPTQAQFTCWFRLATKMVFSTQQVYLYEDTNRTSYDSKYQNTRCTQ